MGKLMSSMGHLALIVSLHNIHRFNSFSVVALTQHAQENSPEKHQVMINNVKDEATYMFTAESCRDQ
jgi:hypothetical protein